MCIISFRQVIVIPLIRDVHNNVKFCSRNFFSCNDYFTKFRFSRNKTTNCVIMQLLLLELKTIGPTMYVIYPLFLLVSELYIFYIKRTPT